MEIKRDIYLQKLINRMHNGMIKVITELDVPGNHIFYLLFLGITLRNRVLRMTILSQLS